MYCPDFAICATKTESSGAAKAALPKKSVDAASKANAAQEGDK
jgi:hypothetical protein